MDQEKQVATHQSTKSPADQDGDGSPVWAVSGDLLLVARVAVDPPSDIEPRSRVRRRAIMGRHPRRKPIQGGRSCL